jgi:NAD(P)-dependent dehydrogenase (short-subunit alcohol dehydrogenase family)
MGWHCHSCLSVAYEGMTMGAKTVLVVGAGGVLGVAVAREFSQAGYKVIGVRRDSHSSASNVDVEFDCMYYCDFMDREAVQNVTDQVVMEHGAIDVLVYNAAYLVMAPFLELTDDDFTTAWKASVGGAVVCAQAALPFMLKR